MGRLMGAWEGHCCRAFQSLMAVSHKVDHSQLNKLGTSACVGPTVQAALVFLVADV
jgi:hypothetical protein